VKWKPTILTRGQNGIWQHSGAIMEGCPTSKRYLGHKTDLILYLCNAIGATTYLAGTGGKSYLEDEKFENAGITPVFSSFSQQCYPQLFGEFVGNLAVVDVLMNCGYFGTRRLLGMKSEHG